MKFGGISLALNLRAHDESRIFMPGKIIVCVEKICYIQTIEFCIFSLVIGFFKKNLFFFPSQFPSHVLFSFGIGWELKKT